MNKLVDLLPDMQLSDAVCACDIEEMKLYRKSRSLTLRLKSARQTPREELDRIDTRILEKYW